MKKRNLIFTLIIACLCTTGYAQRKKTKAVVKPKPQPVQLSAADLLYRNMLGATAKVMFVDSVVVEKSLFLSSIPLNPEAGTLTSYPAFFKEHKYLDGSVYQNEFKNTIYYSEGDSTRRSAIYTSDRIGTEWSDPQRLSEIGDEFEQQNYPFLMADGITLFFAAKGANSLGGYDLFMTRKDGETGKFFQPENYGMPFNSTANDYLLAIDEMDNLGWLVSDRFQPEGKVCIYTFVPTAQRLSFKEGEMSQQQLESLAKLSSIAQTWSFGNRDQALKSIESLKARSAKTAKTTAFRFPINDAKVYTSLSQFKTKQGKELYMELTELYKKQAKAVQTLEEKRAIYHKGRYNEAEAIKALEKNVEQLDAKIHATEKAIRNYENK